MGKTKRKSDTLKRVTTGFLATMLVFTSMFSSKTGTTTVSATESEETYIGMLHVVNSADDGVGHGTASFSGKEGDTVDLIAGSDITINTTPDEGYRVGTVQIIDDQTGNEIEYTTIENDILFAMPYGNITAFVSFEKYELWEVPVEVEEKTNVETIDDYILKNINTKYVGTGSELTPADVMNVTYTMFDNNLLIDKTFDGLWADGDGDGVADNWEAFVAQHENAVLLYEVTENSDYFVGRVDTVSTNNTSITDWLAGYNDTLGNTVDDIIFDTETGLVYVPKTYRTAKGTDTHVVGSTRIQILYAVKDTENPTTQIKVDVEGTSVNGEIESTGVAEVSMYGTSTQIQVAKDSKALDNVKENTINEVVVNNVALPDGAYSYDEETGVLTLDVAPATIDTVSVDMSNDFGKSVDNVIDGVKSLFVTDASAVASQVPGTWVTTQTLTAGTILKVASTSMYYADPNSRPAGWGEAGLFDDYQPDLGAPYQNAVRLVQAILGGNTSQYDGITSDDVIKGSGLGQYTYSAIVDNQTVNTSGNSITVPHQVYNLYCAHVGVTNEFALDKDFNQSPDQASGAYIRVLSVSGGTAIVAVVAPTITTQAGAGLFAIAWQQIPQNGNIALTKVSDNSALLGLGNYSLEGAVFSVRDSSNIEVGRITTNSQGQGSLNDIPQGTYTIVELTPSPGHLLAGNQSVTVTAGGTAEVRVTEPTANDPGVVSIQKVDSNGNVVAQGDASLEGAEFTLKYWDNTSGTTSGTPTNTWVYKTDSDGDIYFDNESQLISGTLYRDVVGQPTFPVGTYNITETKAPTGYLINSSINNTFVVQVVDDFQSVIGQQQIIVDEPVITSGTVTIEKWDVDTNTNNPQGDATFEGIQMQIINRSANPVKLSSSSTAIAVGGVVTTLTLDKNGKASTAGLPYGTYEVREVDAKTGQTGYHNTGIISRTFSITSNGQTVNLNTSGTAIKNDVVRGGFELQKWSNGWNEARPMGDATLAGAVISLYNRSSNAVYIDGVLYEPNAKIADFTTDENYMIKSPSNSWLPYGSYELIETKAPVGYLNTGVISQSFTVRSEGVVWSGTSTSTSIKNDEIYGGFTINKRDTDTTYAKAQGDATLKDAAFTITNVSLHPIKFDGKEYAVGEVITTIYTDADGFAATGRYDLPYGTYRIDEVVAPTGYQLAGKLTQTVSIREHGVYVDLTDVETSIMNDVMRGGVEINKRDSVTLETTGQGDARLRDATFDIINRSTNSVVVDGVEYQPGEVVTSIITDTNGYAATGKADLPYGTYQIIEVDPPEGYQLSGILSQMFIIREGHQNVHVDMTGQATSIHNDVITAFGVEIYKRDYDSKEYEAQGDATLEGAKFELTNQSENAIVINEVRYEVGDVIEILETDKNGYVQTLTPLPYGTYQLEEIEAPDGYTLDGVTKQVFQVRTSHWGTTVKMTGTANSILNEVVRGGVSIAKWDIETNEQYALGNANFANAEVEIVNRSEGNVFVENVWYKPGEVVKTVTLDENGNYTTANDLLPYGTYEIRETGAPEGYLLEGELSKTFEIREDGVIVDMNNDEGAIKNQVKRGDLELHKITDGEGKPLANVKFEIKSNTTGEAHIFVTDKDGYAKTSSKWNLHSNNTNRGRSSTDGVWFGIDSNGNQVEVNDDLGALPYDTYTITELLCDANENYILVEPFEVTISNDNTVINIGDVTNDWRVVPLGTTFVDDVTRSHEATVSGNNTLTDYVELQNLDVGREYILDAILMDKSTGEALLIQGGTIENSVRFLATEENMIVEVPFSFNTLELQDKEIVAFETLSLVKMNGEPLEINRHQDLNDAGQTIYFEPVTVGTTLTNDRTENHGTVASGTQSFTDVVAMTGLTVGDTYVVVGQLMINDGEGGQPLIINGREVVNEVTFVADANEMNVEVPFTIDTTVLGDKDIVAFETLFIMVDGERVEIADHKDITDEGQTVGIEPINIITTALDVVTESHDAIVSGKSEIRDLVALDGLIVGKTYTLVGVPHRLSDGEALLDDNGEVMTSTVEFEATETSMFINVPFTMDTTSFRDDAIVIFEYLYDNDNMDIPCSSHDDLEDKQQTVEYSPLDVQTKAFDINTGENVGYAGITGIEDIVTMNGLVVGQTYTAVAVLMDPETGEPLQVPYQIASDIDELRPDAYVNIVNSLGEPDEDMMFVTGYTLFVAQDVTQDISVSLPLNAINLANRDVVVYEYLFDAYNTDTPIGEHVDITDEDQTVSYIPVDIQTQAFDTTTDKSEGHAQETSIRDVVTMTGLVKGDTYTAIAILMEKDTEAPLQQLVVGGEEVGAKAIATLVAMYGKPTDENSYVIGSTTFVAESQKQEVEVIFDVDATELAGKSMVVYEYLFYNSDLSTPVGEHTDITDKKQTVTYVDPQIGTKAVNRDNGEQHVVRGRTFILDDTVSYEGLIAGETYTFTGVIMDKATGKAMLDANGNTITSTVVHTPTKSKGEVVVSFEIDTEHMQETTLVVFEDVYVGEKIGKNDKPIATHSDINDANQSIRLISPEVEKEIVETGQQRMNMIVIGGLVGVGLLAGLGCLIYVRKRHKN